MNTSLDPNTIEDRHLEMIALELTLACNMRCLHCGSSASSKTIRKNSLTFDDWCQLIKDLKVLEPSYITLSGGEPTLFKGWMDIIETIENIHGKGISSMITNGSLLNKESIYFLKKHGLKNIGISIDGNREIHEKIRRKPNIFPKIEENIKILLEAGIPLSIVTSVNKLNFPILSEIRDWLIDLGVKAWQLQATNTFGRASGIDEDFSENTDYISRDISEISLNLSKLDYLKLCNLIANWKEEYKDKIIVHGADSIGYCHPVTDKILGEDVEWQGCNAGVAVLGVQSNGNVTGCLSLQDDYFVVGNIKKDNIVDIWNKPELFHYTCGYDPEKMEGSCKNCSDKKRCKAGCLGMAYSIHGTIYQNEYCYKAISSNINLGSTNGSNN